MSTRPRILAFAGSTRTDSFNKKLVKIAARGAELAGAEVTLVDLRDFPMPLFDEDLEASAGLPEPATRLKQLMVEHDGLMISSPEYNSSVTAVLKNTIDWCSRAAGGGPAGKEGLVAYAGKGAVLMSASPGALGGLRGLVHLRSILGNIGVILLPNQIAISRAHEAFSPEGNLKDATQQANVEGLGRKLAELLAKLK